eukprot:10839453-Prorocentrum_lima.AAC.1
MEPSRGFLIKPGCWWCGGRCVPFGASPAYRTSRFHPCVAVEDRYLLQANRAFVRRWFVVLVGVVFIGLVTVLEGVECVVVVPVQVEPVDCFSKWRVDVR